MPFLTKYFNFTECKAKTLYLFPGMYELEVYGASSGSFDPSLAAQEAMQNDF